MSFSGYKRTPNCECVICGKPLYRRPNELKRVRHVACMEHRAEAQVREGQTERQKEALKLGRRKGTNNLTGIPKSEASKVKRSKAMKKWCAENTDAVAARSEKTRGENHYKWNGGSSKLNVSIRQMTEHRNWMDGVKEKDSFECTRCPNTDDLESHHIKSLVETIQEHEIRNREDARNTPELWDISNGITLCRRCHYAEHERQYNH